MLTCLVLITLSKQSMKTSTTDVPQWLRTNHNDCHHHYYTGWHDTMARDGTAGVVSKWQWSLKCRCISSPRYVFLILLFFYTIMTIYSRLRIQMGYKMTNGHHQCMVTNHHNSLPPTRQQGEMKWEEWGHEEAWAQTTQICVILPQVSVFFNLSLFYSLK